MNFDSGRRIKRMESSKRRREERNKRRYSNFKAAQEAQRRMERLVAMGVIG